MAPPPEMRRTTVMSGLLAVALVAQRLERADDHGGFVPVPEPDCGLALPLGDLPGQHLVQGDLLDHRYDLRAQDLPVMVFPLGGVAQRAAHHPGHCIGIKTEHHRALAQSCGDRVADGGVAGIGAQPGERCIQVFQRVIGLKEEVPVQRSGGDHLIRGIQIHNDQFAADYLVFTVMHHAAILSLTTSSTSGWALALTR